MDVRTVLLGVWRGYDSLGRLPAGFGQGCAAGCLSTKHDACRYAIVKRDDRYLCRLQRHEDRATLDEHY